VKSGLVWQTPPSALATNLFAWLDKVEAAVEAVARLLASEMEAEAQSGAPWQDRTGNARKGLRGSVERDAAGRIVRAYLTHGPGIDYGVYLELKHGGRFAVIWPTIQRKIPDIERHLAGIFKR
jgi:hypothetical protein